MRRALASLLLIGVALAGDWTLTGTATRRKNVGFLEVSVYEISHHVRRVPEAKSKQAMIDLEDDKKFVLTFLRDLDKEKLRTSFQEAFALNGYADEKKIARFLEGIPDVKEKETLTIVYDAKSKTTLGGKGEAIDGIDFMKATWSIWFGKIDDPKLGDALLAGLK